MNIFLPFSHNKMISVGRLKPEAMITGKIRMDEIEEKGFRALVHDKDNQVKILVDVGLGISPDPTD